MNKLLIALLTLVPAFVIAGGVAIPFWNTGYELQPIWCRLSGCVVVLVIIFNLRNILTEPATRATRKHRERMHMAIFSVIIFPMAVGFCLFMLEEFSLNSGADSSIHTLDALNEKMQAMILKVFAYLPFVINCWYICLEGIKPLLVRLKYVS